jgi:hypothetical protein
MCTSDTLAADVDRAGRDADAFCLQMQVHRLQHRAAKVVLFKQMAKAQNRRFIRRRSHAEVYASKPPQCRGLVIRLFHAPGGQVKPLLHEVRPQHDRQAHRTTPVARLRVVRLNQRL